MMLVDPAKQIVIQGDFMNNREAWRWVVGPRVRFRRVKSLVREGSPLVKLRNSA
jgi:hypothetical protein